MANKRTPQTLKKRQRERDKQMQRQEKIARRIERNSKKRLAKQNGTPPPAEGVAEEAAAATPPPIPIPAPAVTPTPRSS